MLLTIELAGEDIVRGKQRLQVNGEGLIIVYWQWKQQKR